MSEIEATNNPEVVGQLFGLFGCDDNTQEEEKVDKSEISEEGEIVEIRDNFAINTDKAVEINENECIICHSNQIKYRCPKCQAKTCSLDCCLSHKTSFNCNGIRDKLSFVKLKDFTQSEFLSDYFFLEDVDRVLDSTSRERRSIINSKPILPKWLQKMVREARLRGITLRIMPAGFQRRKQNRTCYMYNEKTINWDIQLKFVHAIDTNQKQLDQPSDQQTVHSEFSYVKPRVSENTKLSTLISEVIQMEGNKTDGKLCSYEKSGIEGMSVLFRDESYRTVERKYFDLDFNKTIGENLCGKTVIEFPTFLVILNQFKHLFDICSQKSTEKSCENSDK